jgi:hypothetical protein
MPIGLPLRFVVSISAFGSWHYEVRWRRRQLFYRKHDGSQATVVPSDADWETFWSDLDAIGVWSWQRSYVDLEILDGVQWSIEISNGSSRVRCSGSNAYPGGKHVLSAKPFGQFLEAVEALVRQPFGK